MIIVDCVQNTEEWFQARLGVPTASEFNKIVKADGTRSDQRKKYLWQKAGEAITKTVEETYQSQSMLRGQLLEEEARSYYSFIKNVDVQKVGFCLNCLPYPHGCSPDGLVGDDGMVQIKCPTLAVHVGYLLAGKLPTDYFQQVQGELLVTGRQWCDFVSYYPNMNALLIRIYPDPIFTELLSVELESFGKELKETIIKLRS